MEFIVKKSKEIQIGLVIVILILPCVMPFIVKMDLAPFISPIIWYFLLVIVVGIGIKLNKILIKQSVAMQL